MAVSLSVSLDTARMAARTDIEGLQTHIPAVKTHNMTSFPDIQRPASEGNCYINPEPDL